MAYTKGLKMFVAGVFTDTLPPSFGPNTGAFLHSYRAGIPFANLVPPQLPHVALALDFERAWVEEFVMVGHATAIRRHYAHRARMHLLLVEVTLNNTSAHAVPA